ncbi:MAG: DUF2059 domain-containing protein [Paracoccaceae bacterium]
MSKFSVAVFFWVILVLPLRAEVAPNVLRLAEALGLPEIIEVMREEGINYGDDLAEGMFEGRSYGGWQQSVENIYDVDRMGDVALTGFGAELNKASITEITDFFESDLGVEIIALEISARRALMDDAVDEANKERVAAMIAGQHPRIELLQQFIDVNDLLETNVVGALNSNFSFYTGLVDGGAYSEPITEDKILSDVWEQEVEIRADTNEWLFGFLSLAYTPLSDADLVAYIEFSESQAGQMLNTALFAGFDTMFAGISHSLGLAAAKIMASEDL